MRKFLPAPKCLRLAKRWGLKHHTSSILPGMSALIFLLYRLLMALKTNGSLCLMNKNPFTGLISMMVIFSILLSLLITASAPVLLTGAGGLTKYTLFPAAANSLA